jgi:hypothetical protein
VSGWQAEPKADEVVAYHASRARGSLVPESVRRLAVAMVEHALADLERPRWIRGAGRYVPADYRPDPEGAVAWLHRGGDAPLSARWCEQITGVCLDPLRRKYPLRAAPPRARTQSAQERRTRRGRPARPDDAALREYGF